MRVVNFHYRYVCFIDFPSEFVFYLVFRGRSIRHGDMFNIATTQ